MKRAKRVGVVVAMLLTSASWVQPTHAGTYVMRNCDVPSHGNAPMGPWETAEMAPNARLVDACANGDGVGVAFAGPRQMSGGAWGILTLATPATGPQSNIRFVKAVLWYAARLAGSGSSINMTSLVFHSDRTVRLGVTHGPPGSDNLMLEQQFSPMDTNRYKIGIVCGPLMNTGEPVPDCVADANMPLQIRGMEVTLSEETQPIVSMLGGTLLEGGPQSGIQTVAYSATDLQSGLATIDVLLDGALVASRDLTNRCPYYDFTVCPDSDEATLQVDTRAVPNGSHRLVLRVRDAASNERVIDVPNSIEVTNSSVGRLTARFRGSSRSTLTVPYGRRVSIQGRLSGGIGPARAGAQVDVLERVARRGARERLVGLVRTRADGLFLYRVPRSRPSRHLRFAYRSGTGEQAESRVLTIHVRAAASLRASLRGRTIRYSGRVLSRPIPSGGKRVRLEGRAPGFAWSRFATLRTDGTGRFAGSYRLPIRRPGVRLQIRAVVTAQLGYPYLSSRSQPVVLRVR